MSKPCVLITKPKVQAEKLDKLIQQSGYTSFIFPTIVITPFSNKKKLLQQLEQLSSSCMAVFVSQNAVHQIMPDFSPLFSSIKIYAIGPGTMQALEDYHIPVTALPETFSSEGLLALPALQTIHQKKIFIFTGKNSKKLLADTLRERGAQVKTVICYKRRLPNTTLPTPLSIDIIITASVESLNNLIKLTPLQWRDKLLRCPIIVISQNMVGAAKKQGFKEILLAENASNQAVLNTLNKWYSNQ